MSIAVRYLHNLDHGFRRWTEGWRPGDQLCNVATVTMPSATPFDEAAERAFVYYQRIDGDHEQLDRADAPSMSIGDVVVMFVDPFRPAAAFAVRSVGFEEIDFADVNLVHRGKRTVRELVQEQQR